MDIFDRGAGSVYAILAVISCVYLFWGFGINLRSMLKAMMAVQILGDLFFFDFLQDYPIFSFIKTLSTEDRFKPLLVMMGGVAAMDGFAFLVRKWFETRGISKHPVGRKEMPSIAAGPEAHTDSRGRLNQHPLNLNPSLARQVGYVLAILAAFTKLSELYFLNIIEEQSVVDAILTWNPERSLGFAFLETIGNSLLPIGLALITVVSRRKRHWLSFVLILLFGSLSPWKAAIPHMVVLYGFILFQFGTRELRSLLLKKSTIVVACLILIFIPIKSQYRNIGTADFDLDSLVEQFVLASDARLMGGIFQTYCYTVKSLDRGFPFMRGGYNVQALYLWVPRLLWSDKPLVASVAIYDYLELTREEAGPYGETAFAITVFGSFYLDFGWWGALLASAIFGGLISAAENFLDRMGRSRNDVIRIFKLIYVALFWRMVFPLAESGVPSAFTEALVAGAVTTATLLYFLPARRWQVLRANLSEKAQVIGHKAALLRTANHRWRG